MLHDRLTHLTSEQRGLFFEDLYMLSMGQLRTLCEQFGLSRAGKKVFLIECLKQYLITGARLRPEALPEVSCAQTGHRAELHPDARILAGQYKNDLKTRLFMKSLVGDHFHFTAAGIDWIRESWEQGKPPTYKEFAEWWQAEYAVKDTQRTLKKEWAFLTFVQAYQGECPNASQGEIMKQWKVHQAQAVARVHKALSLAPESAGESGEVSPKQRSRCMDFTE